jgi:hypothetical protein
VKDVAHGEILSSQIRFICQLRPNFAVVNALLFQKFEAVSDNLPSRGKHVRIMYAVGSNRRAQKRHTQTTWNPLPSTECINHSIPVTQGVLACTS